MSTYFGSALGTAAITALASSGLNTLPWGAARVTTRLGLVAARVPLDGGECGAWVCASAVAGRRRSCWRVFYGSLKTWFLAPLPWQVETRRGSSHPLPYFRISPTAIHLSRRNSSENSSTCISRIYIWIKRVRRDTLADIPDKAYFDLFVFVIWAECSRSLSLWPGSYAVTGHR